MGSHPFWLIYTKVYDGSDEYMSWYNNPIFLSSLLGVSGAVLTWLGSVAASIPTGSVTSLVVGLGIFVVTEIHYWASENSPPSPPAPPSSQPSQASTGSGVVNSSGSVVSTVTAPAPSAPTMTFNGVITPIGFITSGNGHKDQNVPTGSVVVTLPNGNFQVTTPSGDVVVTTIDPRVNETI